MRSLIIALGVALVALCADSAASAAYDAAILFAKGVMPSLLPVMALCRLATGRGKGAKLCAGTLLLGLITGSPGGARLIGARAPYMTNRQTLFLLGATGTVNPLFLLGAVAGWTDDSRAALITLIIHWLSALIAGAVAAALPVKLSAPPAPPEERLTLSSVISGAMNALLLVLGAMMLGAVAFSLIEKGLIALFPSLGAGTLACVHALIEIGGGARAVIDSLESPYAALCALCSFGGVSLICQSAAFLGEGIPARVVALIRIIHALTAYAIARMVF